MTRQLSRSHISYVALMSLAVASTAEAQPFEDSLHSVENRWAKAAYKTVGRQQGKDLRALLKDVRLLHETHPDSPEAAAWHGIVARTYRDIKGSMSLA